jgi:hypothetical protein
MQKIAIAGLAILITIVKIIPVPTSLNQSLVMELKCKLGMKSYRKVPSKRDCRLCP